MIFRPKRYEFSSTSGVGHSQAPVYSPHARFLATLRVYLVCAARAARRLPAHRFGRAGVRGGAFSRTRGMREGGPIPAHTVREPRGFTGAAGAVARSAGYVERPGASNAESFRSCCVARRGEPPRNPCIQRSGISAQLFGPLRPECYRLSARRKKAGPPTKDDPTPGHSSTWRYLTIRRITSPLPSSRAPPNSARPEGPPVSGSSATSSLPEFGAYCVPEGRKPKDLHSSSTPCVSS